MPAAAGEHPHAGHRLLGTLLPRVLRTGAPGSWAAAWTQPLGFSLSVNLNPSLGPGKRHHDFQYWRLYLPRQPLSLRLGVSLADPGIIFTQSSRYLLRTFLRENSDFQIICL